MKTVYNNINIFFSNNTFIINGERKKEVEVEDIVSHIIVNDNLEKVNPLVAELEERILQSENEKNELIEELNHKTQ